MNITKNSTPLNPVSNLVFIKGQEKTNSILFIRKSGKYYKIIYANNPKKIYTYKSIHIIWHRCLLPKEAKNLIVYKNGIPVSNVKEIYKFPGYIKLLYKNGKYGLYPSTNISFEKSAKLTGANINILEYLKELSKESGIKDDEGTSLLFKQFTKINKISSQSALFNYINHNLPRIKAKERIQPIFPFGFNKSQKIATKRAILNKISVIEGPPGTGKTQTILNIIANAVFSNKSIAIVSNNNSATDNVFEKLYKHNLSFIAAPLGNATNKDNFFNNQQTGYPNMSNWTISSGYKKYLQISLKISGLFLDFMLYIQNKLAKLQNTLSQLSLENQYYTKYYNINHSTNIQFTTPKIISSNGILKLWVHYQFLIENDLPISKSIYLKCLFWCASSPKELFNNDSTFVISHLQRLYYDKKEKELQFKERLYRRILKNFCFEKTSNSHQEKAMILFKATLKDRFSNKKRPIFTKEVLSKHFSKFINEYPIILSSTHSLKNCSPEGYLFDYVIVDEASQVDLVTGALVLSCAKKIVVVGDTKQLPNIISDEFENKVTSISELFKIDDKYNYTKQSFLSSIATVFPNLAKTMLCEHYRCNPQIIEFCNQRFYDNNLIILSKNDCDCPISLYETALGNHARHNKNQRQIDVILEEILPSLNCDSSQSIGIISPYCNQTDELKTILKNKNIEVATVHKFQGREKDIIILSTVSNQVNNFISKPDLLNVAISRAKNKLIVIVAQDDSFLNGNSIISELIRYIKYNNFQVIESQLYSIFDLLYSKYSNKLTPLLKRARSVSTFKSENIANAMIEEVLSEERFKHLKHILHLPLNVLIKDTSLLTEDETNFVRHPKSHLDFMIFSKLDKRPILAIEVDGYAFHEANPEQLLRDKKKDSILSKYNIPILRFSTIGSGEKDRLADTLNFQLDIK